MSKARHRLGAEQSPLLLAPAFTDGHPIDDITGLAQGPRSGKNKSHAFGAQLCTRKQERAGSLGNVTSTWSGKPSGRRYLFTKLVSSKPRRFGMSGREHGQAAELQKLKPVMVGLCSGWEARVARQSGEVKSVVKC